MLQYGRGGGSFADITPRPTRLPTILSDDVEIDLEPSLLAFESRVLALAEDPAVPLLERLAFWAS